MSVARTECFLSFKGDTRVDAVIYYTLLRKQLFADIVAEETIYWSMLDVHLSW